MIESEIVKVSPEEEGSGRVLVIAKEKLRDKVDPQDIFDIEVVAVEIIRNPLELSTSVHFLFNKKERTDLVEIEERMAIGL